MKNIFYIAILVCSISFAQTNCNDAGFNSDSLKAELISGDKIRVWEAIGRIKSQKCENFLPFLEEQIYLQEDLDVKFSYLEAIAYLKSKNIHKITDYLKDITKHIDWYNLDDKERLKYFILDGNIEIAWALFITGDNSGIDELFANLNSGKYPYGFPNELLVRVAKAKINHSDKAKELLLQRYNESETWSPYEKQAIFESLVELYGDDFCDEIRYAILNDPDEDVRYSASKVIFKCVPVENVAFYSEVLRKEKYFPYELVDSIYVRNSNFDYYLNLIKDLPDSIKDRARFMPLSLRYISLSPSQVIDSLLYFNSKVFEVGWVKDELFYQASRIMLIEIKNYLVQNNHILAMGKIKDYQSLCRQSIHNGVLTKWSYKFPDVYTDILIEKLSELTLIKNLLLNPGFESENTSSWYTGNTFGGAEFSFYALGDDAISGSFSGLIEITKAGSSNNRPMIYTKLKQKTEAGKKYSFRFKIKTISGNPGIKYLNYGAGLKSYTGSMEGQFGISFTATSASEYVYLYIDGTKEGSFLIDDLEFYEE